MILPQTVIQLIFRTRIPVTKMTVKVAMILEQAILKKVTVHLIIAQILIQVTVPLVQVTLIHNFFRILVMVI